MEALAAVCPATRDAGGIGATIFAPPSPHSGWRNAQVSLREGIRFLDTKNRPERKLRPERTWGKGRVELPGQLAAQDASEAEDARTEQHDAAGLRSRTGGAGGGAASGGAAASDRERFRRNRTEQVVVGRRRTGVDVPRVAATKAVGRARQGQISVSTRTDGEASCIDLVDVIAEAAGADTTVKGAAVGAEQSGVAAVDS